MERNREHPVLDELKNEILATFQAATGEEDQGKSIETLENNQWNLEAAVENYMSTHNVSTQRQSSNATWGGTLYHWSSNILGYVIPSGLTNSDSTTDPKAACIKFLGEFERNYGNTHPAFVEGSYNDALVNAKSHFKFLVVYLHSTIHQDTLDFCRGTLCTELITDFINEHFVSWAGNINMTEAFKISNLLSASTYPFIAVICNNSIGGVTILDRLEGSISTEDLISRLTNVLEMHGHILVAAKLEHDEREVNRRIREEQDEAFLQSLAEDQEKERKIRQEEEQRREDERKQQRMQEIKEKKRKTIVSQLPPEPDLTEKEATQLVIRLTDGSRLQRRFYPTDSLQTVFDFVNSSQTAMLDVDYDLVTNFPRKIFSQEGAFKVSLKESGLCPQASLFVQEK